MNLRKPELAIGLAVLALSACGGTTNSNQVTSSAFSALATDTDTLVEEVDALDDEITQNIPTTGSAAYSGFIYIDEHTLDSDGEFDEGTFLAIAPTTVNVDFEADTISGNTGQFYELDIAEINALDEAGSDEGFRISDLETAIEIDGTVTYDSDSDLVATLTKSSGEVATFDYQENDVFVEYFGENAEYLGVFAEGVSTAEGRTALNSDLGVLAGRD